MKKNFLIVNANYYNDISQGLLKSAKNLISKNNKIKIINVPGVFEIPVTISKNSKKYDAFIALGCVIKGKTPRFELITSSTFDALIRISVDFNKPITNGIITCLNKKQAIERSSIKDNSSKNNKGYEAAKAVINLLKNEPKNS